MKYAYLILKADQRGKPELIESENSGFTLKELQKAASCDCIEIVRVKNPIDGSVMCMVVDESGKLKNKRINLRASLLYGSVYDYIAGDAVVCKEGMTEEGPDLIKMDMLDALELKHVFTELKFASGRSIR